MQMNIGKLSRYIDRRLAALTVVMISLAAVLHFVVLGSIESERQSIQDEYTETQSGIADLEKRVSEVRQGGSADISQLLKRLGKMEGAMPKSHDILATTAEVARIATAAGVSLETFAEQTGDRSDVKLPATALDKGALAATAYRFSVIGPPTSVLAFLEALMSSSKWVASVPSIALAPKATEDQRVATEDAHIYGPSVGATGVLLLWGMADPPVIAVEEPAVDATPAPSDAAASAQPGSTPAVSSSTPATSASAPASAPAAPATAPAAPATVPAAPASAPAAP